MLGKLERVPNQDRSATAALTYWRIVVYTHDTSSPECLLLTDGELARIRVRATKNPEDCVLPPPPVPWLGWTMLGIASAGIVMLMWLT